MITPEYVQQMAMYNAWQNKSLKREAMALSEEELLRNRGAFFGSIFLTMNHLLWGDLLWLSRFDGGPAQSPVIADSMHIASDLAEWADLRAQTDQRITDWAEGLSEADLTGDLTWFSGSINAEVTKPRDMCVVHFFNHQTHHRGQIHAMMTAAGGRPDATDLVFMP